MGFVAELERVDRSKSRTHAEAPGRPNPYLAARREWDERYGDLVTRARNWRLMALLSGLIALMATTGIVWLSVRSHVVPFVVLVDNLGRSVASGIADQTEPGDDRLKRASIFN